MAEPEYIGPKAAIVHEDLSSVVVHAFPTQGWAGKTTFPVATFSICSATHPAATRGPLLWERHPARLAALVSKSIGGKPAKTSAACSDIVPYI